MDTSLSKTKGFGLVASIAIIAIAAFLIGGAYYLGQISQKGVAPLDNLKNAKDTIQNINNKLDLSNQGLSKLPEEALSRTDLIELDISYNSLTGALPAEIRHLQNLKILNASNNLMTGIPAEIGQLTNLEVLDLSNNKLTGLPYEMANLKKLRILNLSGNNYAEQDLDIIRRGLSSDVKIIL